MDFGLAGVLRSRLSPNLPSSWLDHGSHTFTPNSLCVRYLPIGGVDDSILSRLVRGRLCYCSSLARWFVCHYMNRELDFTSGHSGSRSTWKSNGVLFCENEWCSFALALCWRASLGQKWIYLGIYHHLCNYRSGSCAAHLGR